MREQKPRPAEKSERSAVLEQDSPEVQGGSDRRQFLVAGAASVAGLALAGGSDAQEGKPRRLSELKPLSLKGKTTDKVEVLDASTFYQHLPQIRAVNSHKDVLETTLDATTVERIVPSTKGVFRFQSRSYGTDAVGPTLRVRPGQTLKLNFVNSYVWNQDEENNTCPSADHNVPNCLNTTNVHTHGLHVSPEKPSDDIFVEIWPKDDPLQPTDNPNSYNGSFDYTFQIPWDHAPGTHWYHAHRHGSTAYNVARNQFGALIVEEPDDQEIMPGIKDEILILAEALHRKPAAPGERRTKMVDDGPLFTINGVSEPTITMRPNEIQRWRIISASGTNVGYNPLGFHGVAKVWLVAWDGITLSGPPRELDLTKPLALAPGNRADVLVQAPSEEITDGSLDRLGTDVFKLCDTPGTGFPNPNSQITTQLAAIVVSGTPVTPPALPTELPASKSAYLKPITDAEVAATPKRTVTFEVTGNNQTLDRFRVGYSDDQGGSYGPLPYSSAFNIEVPYGNVEEWTIENIAEQDHPYHIHVNPFQIVEIKESDGTVRQISESERVWSDTANVPRRGYVKIRSRFVDFRGTYVLHCHILNHEDRGMMMNVRVS